MAMTPDIDAQARALEARMIVADIRPKLAKCEPEVVGAVLAELLSIWLASHHPDFRDQARNMMRDLVDDLVPIAVAEMIALGALPQEWSGNEASRH